MIYRERFFKRTRKLSKYKNVPQDYSGITYHSRKEAKYARDLDWRLKAGEISSWDRQVKIELWAWDVHICDYYIDFIVYYPDGRKEYVEVKGFEKPDWRLKWKLFVAQMKFKEPDAELIIVR